MPSIIFFFFSDEAMRKAGVAHNKSSKEMESHVFMKAKTRVKYLDVCVFLSFTLRGNEVFGVQYMQQTGLQAKRALLILQHLMHTWFCA